MKIIILLMPIILYLLPFLWADWKIVLAMYCIILASRMENVISN